MSRGRGRGVHSEACKTIGCETFEEFHNERGRKRNRGEEKLQEKASR